MNMKLYIYCFINLIPFEIFVIRIEDKEIGLLMVEITTHGLSDIYI